MVYYLLSLNQHVSGSNSRTIKSTSSDILGSATYDEVTVITIPPSVDDIGDGNGSGSDDSRSDPFEHLSEGPRTVHINRTSRGYGFTVAGRRPVHVGQVRNDGPAHLKGKPPSTTYGLRPLQDVSFHSEHFSMLLLFRSCGSIYGETLNDPLCKDRHSCIIIQLRCEAILKWM